MKTVNKKLSTEYYSLVKDGTKTFELRKDEDGIRPGDWIRFWEWCKNGQATGNSVLTRVRYTLRNYEGLKPGYAIYGIEVIGQKKHIAF